MEHLGPSEIINHKDSMKRSYAYPKTVAQEVPTKERMGAEGRNLPGIVQSHLQGSCCGMDETDECFSLRYPFLCNSVSFLLQCDICQ